MTFPGDEMTKLHVILPGVILIVHLHTCGSHGCDSHDKSGLTRDDNLNRYKHSDSSKLELVHQSSNCAQNMALVVYTPTSLGEFRQDKKTFTFAGRIVTIRQRWEELGVAAVVWDAAVVLAEYLEKSVHEERLALRGRSVIELGAGTGLVGIVAALLGGDVTLTDRPVALEQLRANVVENSPQKDAGHSGVAKVQELTWGESLQDFPRPFDVIVGADIVYIQDTFPKLLETLVHLSNENTVVLLSCRIRYARDEQFLDAMRELFSVRELLHDNVRGIHVYQAQLL